MAQNTNTHMFKIRPFILNIHTEPPPRMYSLLSSYGNWNFSYIKPNKILYQNSLSNTAISDIRPGFKLKPAKSELSSYHSGCYFKRFVCCMPDFTRQQCPILSQAFRFWCGSAQLFKRTATSHCLTGFNTSDPEAVQLDPAKNLDQTQSGRKWVTLQCQPKLQCLALLTLS